MSNKCLPLCELTTCNSDELGPDEREALNLHLVECEKCRAEYYSTQRLLRKLRSLPAVQTSRDLTSSILERIREPISMPAPARWPRIAALAAAVALMAGGALYYSTQGRAKSGDAVASTTAITGETASANRALDWFCQNQEKDGSWNAEKWGGNRRFSVALTALPLIALLDGEPTPARAEAAQRASFFVRQQQNADGTFGEPFRESPYIQSVSTLALLHAYQRQPSQELRSAIDASMRVILSTQTQDGGWGYLHSPFANVPITLWHKDVLALASSLGWENARPSLSRAQAWLASQPAHEDSVEPDGEDAGSDYHRAYFAAADLRHAQTPQARQKLAALRQSLIATQAGTGAESGTWEPTDQWSRAGGRIYSTALASMVLNHRFQ